MGLFYRWMKLNEPRAKEFITPQQFKDYTVSGGKNLEIVDVWNKAFEIFQSFKTESQRIVCVSVGKNTRSYLVGYYLEDEKRSGYYKKIVYDDATPVYVIESFTYTAGRASKKLKWIIRASDKREWKCDMDGRAFTQQAEVVCRF